MMTRRGWSGQQEERGLVDTEQRGLAKIGCRPYYFGLFWKLGSTDGRGEVVEVILWDL
jgi:hypothetical protein